MNHWRQTKLYPCMRCGQNFLHDKMYLHVVFHCPARQALTQGDRK